MDYIALAIPAFFALMGLEWGVSKFRGIPVYRFSDWVANLGCGIIQQTFKIVLGLFTFLAYRYLYEHHRLFDLSPSNPWVWFFGFLGIDLAYYWFHRLSHEVNFLWAAHVVHHQSEEYNLGVALRQSAIQGGFSWPFYLPLAFIGLPIGVFAPLMALNLLYQFWIHTQLIGKMGPLEWVLNTPSHHRVHHGQNPQYIDRNHAGTLIIWDRMFGTFEPEVEAVHYGVTEPPNSWNALFSNVHHFLLSAKRTREASTWKGKLGVWLLPPGYVPEGASDDGKRTNPLEKYDRKVSPRLGLYVGTQLLVIAAVTTTYLFFRKLIDMSIVLAWGASIIASMGSLGMLLDRSRGAAWVEAGRIIVLFLLFARLIPEVFWSTSGLAVAASYGAASLAGLAWALLGSQPKSKRQGDVSIE